MGWTAIALSDDLAPGDVAGTRLDGQEVALWRDMAGVAHAWEDRCPHRGMRLSFGFVRSGHLTCLYHGWQYDAQGRCRAIPAHPELTPTSTIRPTRHGCVEASGMVWHGAGEPPPDMPAWPLRSLYCDVAVAALGPLRREKWRGTTLLLAPQPRNASQSCLHVVALTPPNDVAALLHDLAALRRSLEAA